MIPVNQFIVGNDPTLSPGGYIQNIEEQLRQLDSQRQILLSTQQRLLGNYQNDKVQSNARSSIWDAIDAEIEPLTDEQRNILSSNSDYSEIYNSLQSLVQTEILNLVKSKIENSEEGNKLLQEQLKLIKKLKSGIVDATNKEMNIFKAFKEASKNNPDLTYDEFIKTLL